MRSLARITLVATLAVTLGCESAPRPRAATAGAEQPPVEAAQASATGDEPSFADFAGSEIERFDHFVDARERVIAAMGHDGARACDRNCRYVRARVAAGAVVLDAALADACFAAAASRGEPPYCSGAVRATHPLAAGAPCGIDAECEDGLWCETSANACERAGRCRPRAAVGEPCGAAFSESCTDEENGETSAIECLPIERDRFFDGELSPGATRCVRVVVERRSAGQPCHEWVDDAFYGPGIDADTVVTTVCEPGFACRRGSCMPVEAGRAIGLDGDSCDERYCGEGLRCIDHRCRALVGAACGQGLESQRGVVCVDGRYVATDGMRGAGCDPPPQPSDCAPGLACGADGLCGDPLPLGAPSDFACEQCASGCCSRGMHPSCVAVGL